jgi:MoaA/NifB/PqqE/SkfB family radical SAM enzyme
MKNIFLPKRAQLVVIRRCNLACAYCNEFDNRSEPIPLEQLTERVEHLRRLKTQEIEFTGGEPLLHPGISTLISKARDLGFGRVMMISNGLLLSRKGIEDLNEAKLDDLQVSIDGVTPNLVTVKALRPLLPKLDLLAEFATFRVTISAVVGSSTPQELIDIVQCGRQYGFIPRVLIRHDKDGQADLSNQEISEYEGIREEINELLSEANGYRAKLLNGAPSPFKCRAGCSYFYVDEWGIVRWCSQQQERFGIPLVEYSSNHLKEQFNTRKPCTDLCTIGCARSASSEHESHPQSLILNSGSVSK